MASKVMPRFGRTLSPAEQRTIVQTTRTPTRSDGPNGGENIRKAKRALPRRPVDFTNQIQRRVIGRDLIPRYFRGLDTGRARRDS
jgi:hypothetical protein